MPKSIESAKTFKADSDNTSDHLPIQMTLNFTMNDNSASYDGDPQYSKKKSKIFWSKFSLADINTKYVTLLWYDSEKGDIDPTDSERAVKKFQNCLKTALLHSCENNLKKEKKTNVMFM